MLPPLADQDTAMLVVPVTVAANCWLPPADNETDVGEIDTATTGVTTALIPYAETRHRP